MDKITFPPLSFLKLIYSNTAVTRVKERERSKRRFTKKGFIAASSRLNRALGEGSRNKREEREKSLSETGAFSASIYGYFSRLLDSKEIFFLGNGIFKRRNKKIPCRNCGGGDRWCCHLSSSYCHQYGAQGLGQRQAYFQPLATMNFVGLVLTTSDRWH
ncbi:hypothetical protein TNCV_4660511 [Trichonephila clavipes]|uniref:Uncharacterized protein n=1 Tax=Trichonephila clavipes TaxID=2585209 RepID=A0A8X6VIC4_TRICX|nr:hypothetical protein TNCV_4660511 [Trichonephila clavipes]